MRIYKALSVIKAKAVAFALEGENAKSRKFLSKISLKQKRALIFWISLNFGRYANAR